MYSINGAIFNADEIKISPQDRALNYGDGVFETIRIKDNTILYADYHYERLLNATKSIHLEINISEIKKWTQEIISVANLNNGIIKINIVRKEGGLFSPISNEGNTIIRARETVQKQQNRIENIGIYTSFEKCFSSTSPFKTINCLEYIKAGIYKQENNFDDLILVNQKKEIVECLYSNISWIKDNKWFSPSINTGCIGGVMLQQIEQELLKKGLKIHFDTYFIDDILNADVVINSNVMGIKYLAKINNNNFNTNHSLVNKLQKLFA